MCALLPSHTSDHDPCGSGGISSNMLGHVHDSSADFQNQSSLMITSLYLKIQKQAEHKYPTIQAWQYAGFLGKCLLEPSSIK